MRFRTIKLFFLSWPANEIFDTFNHANTIPVFSWLKYWLLFSLNNNTALLNILDGCIMYYDFWQNFFLNKFGMKGKNRKNPKLIFSKEFDVTCAKTIAVCTLVFGLDVDWYAWGWGCELFCCIFMIWHDTKLKLINGLKHLNLIRKVYKNQLNKNVIYLCDFCELSEVSWVSK